MKIKKKKKKKPKTLLELITEFSKITGYKINYKKWYFLILATDTWTLKKKNYMLI